MDLLNNPFSILDLSPRDGKDKIIEQAEDKLASGEYDEIILISAQNALMASKSRLDAEIHWLPDLSPKLAKEILQLLNKQPHELSSKLNSLEGLSQANIASNLCDLKIINHQIIEALCKSYSSLIPQSVLSTINQNRNISQFPSVDLPLLIQSLQKLREQHIASAINAITSTLTPEEFMTELVNTFSGSEKNVLDFVEQLVESFTNWATGRLKQLEDQIDLEIQSVKDSCNDKSIEQIITSLRKWDNLSQPKQLIWQAKGLEEPRSKELWNKVRDLAIWLVNEKTLHKAALILTQACAEIFTELHSAADKTQEDIEALNDLLEQEKLRKDFKSFLEVIEKAKENTDLISTEISKQYFSKNGKGIAGSIFEEFIKAEKQSKEISKPDFAWFVLRNFCIFLYDEKNQVEAAYIITKEVLNLSPPDNIKTLLQDDLKTLYKNKLWKDINDALNKKPRQLKRAAKLTKELLPLLTDQEEITNISNISHGIEAAKKKRRNQWIWALVIIGFLTYGAMNDSGKSSKTSTYQQASIPDNGEEIKPPVGKGNVLSKSEVRYCEFMGARLDYILSLFSKDDNPDEIQIRNTKLLTQDLADSIDKATNDFNSRCSEAKYYKQDMADIKVELNQKRAAILEKVKSALSKENKKLIFR